MDIEASSPTTRSKLAHERNVAEALPKNKEKVDLKLKKVIKETKMIDYYPCKSTYRHSLLLHLLVSQRRIVLLTKPPHHIVVDSSHTSSSCNLASFETNFEKVIHPNQTFVWACSNRKIPVFQCIEKLCVVLAHVSSLLFYFL